MRELPRRRGSNEWAMARAGCGGEARRTWAQVRVLPRYLRSCKPPSTCSLHRNLHRSIRVSRSFLVCYLANHSASFASFCDCWNNIWYPPFYWTRSVLRELIKLPMKSISQSRLITLNEIIRVFSKRVLHIYLFSGSYSSTARTLSQEMLHSSNSSLTFHGKRVVSGN